MKTSTLILAAAALLTPFIATPAQHNHAYAGDFNDDNYLDFGNNATGDVISDLGTRTMAYQPSGNNYADEGFVFNGSWTPTASHGRDSSISDPNGALSGTSVRLVLHGVAGPTGATFGFYETGATDVTLSMMTGTTGGTGSLNLTDPLFFAASPSDPYGHLHGRRWVATDEGDYTVTWALINNETGGTLSSLDNP
ncbi:MAG: hypothetical protein WA771_03360, partial [Chthoniobacterales bacterium]